jgi:hypothetical protein
MNETNHKPRVKAKPFTVKIEPPLHVELSDPAAEALRKIRSRYNWNKKTAVELALQKLADGIKPANT